MSTHQCTVTFTFEALIKNKANHVTPNLAVYWLSVDNLTYPTNHVTRRITRTTRVISKYIAFPRLSLHLWLFSFLKKSSVMQVTRLKH